MFSWYKKKSEVRLEYYIYIYIYVGMYVFPQEGKEVAWS